MPQQWATQASPPYSTLPRPYATMHHSSRFVIEPQVLVLEALCIFSYYSRNRHIQWQSQTAHCPSCLKKLTYWRHANIISPTLEDATDTRRAGWHNYDFAHNH